MFINTQSECDNKSPYSTNKKTNSFSQFPAYARPIDGTRKANIPAITVSYFQD